MKHTAFLLIFIALSLSAGGVKPVLSSGVQEGKPVYVPIKPPIDLREESRVQEHDQNATHLGGQK